MAIQSFANRGTADVAHGINSKAARSILPVILHANAREKLLFLDAATALDDLLAWPSLRLEKLKGDRSGQISIRINDQYRICFVWHGNNAINVGIVDYH
jgi:proteic killer suppression protein